MSKEFVGTYLFLDNMYKNADLQRKQQEISRLQGDMQRQRQAAGNANAFPNAGMVDRADYELMKEKVEFYEKLLAEPLAVIAGQVPAFKENYDKEQLVLADWMLSQKAFKETAMDYGVKAGKTPEQIHNEGIKNKEKILDDESNYGNSVSALSDNLKNKLKDKLKN